MRDLPGLNSKVFTADGSYGSTKGTLFVGAVVTCRSGIRTIGHIRSGSIAGGKVLHVDQTGAATVRTTTPFFLPDPGRPVNSKLFIEVSGASAAVTVFIRGPGA